MSMRVGINETNATPIPSQPTPTPTLTFLAPCVGDCDGAGVVTVSDLVKGVNLAACQCESARGSRMREERSTSRSLSTACATR
jgi:hypothetical protein